MSSEMRVRIVETTVPCPECGKPVCNLCAFNQMCQHCKNPLDGETLQRAEDELEAMFRNEAQSEQ
ncbi:hypothetical protein ACIBCT_35380 [Streptosporangium sp. NPDC050855]|uniref:hypothetical protein n=1 Tax=Streptosporangium sp. NPDC050855 TaxID=3366194 RepID=UPI003790090D